MNNPKFKINDFIYYLRQDSGCVKLRSSYIYAIRFEETGVYYLVTIEFGKLHESDCFKTEQEAIDAVAVKSNSKIIMQPVRRSFIERLFGI